MSSTNSNSLSEPTRRPLRLWPAVVIVLLMWAVIKLPGQFSEDAMIKFNGMFFGAAGGTVLFLAWWLFFSRAQWRDRFLLLALCAVMGVAAYYTYHKWIGFFGLVLFALPLVVARRRPRGS